MQDKTFFSIFYSLFFLASVPFGLILWYMLHLPWNQAVVVGIVAGIMIGVPLGLLLRGAERRFVRSDFNSDLALRMGAILTEMGYRREGTFNKSTVYKPTYRAGILADTVVVNTDPYEVMIYGPNVHVDKLIKRLGLTA